MLMVYSCNINMQNQKSIEPYMNDKSLSLFTSESMLAMKFTSNNIKNLE